MGRLRVGVSGSDQFKRPSNSSRRESAGAGASGSKLKLTNSDALSYLKEVKDTFQDQMEKYHMLLDILRDYKNQRIDAGGVIARVKVLFKGHPSLLLGFNPFLPKGCEITINDEDKAPPKKKVEFEETISFVNKVKERFQNNDHVYKSFLDILNMYMNEHKEINEVYHEVAVLFNEHLDLLDEFTRFLPDSAIASLFSPDRINGTLRDLDLDDDTTLRKLHKEQKRRAGKKSRVGRTHEDPDNLSMQCLTDKMKSVGKVEEFGGSREDQNALMKYTYSQGFAFCEKVKERLRSPADYRVFLKCLHIYSREIITREQLRSLVAHVLGKYPDLMEGFNEFIERYERVGVMRQIKSDEGHTSKLVSEEQKEDKEHKCKTEAPPQVYKLDDAVSFVKKVKERFRYKDHLYETFLDILKLYREERKSVYEVYHEVSALLNDHPDLLDEFTKFLPDSPVISMLRQCLDQLAFLI